MNITKHAALMSMSILAFIAFVGSIPTESTGHESTGHESTGHESAGHEPAGHEPVGHERAGDDGAGSIDAVFAGEFVQQGYAGRPFGCEQPGGCQQSGPSRCPVLRLSAPSRFYGQSEALFMVRDNGAFDQPVVRDTNLAAGSDTVLAAPDPGFEFETGVRLMLGYRLGEPWALEGSYFSVLGITADEVITGNNNLALPDLGAASIDFRDADMMRIDYRSDVESAELNLVRTCSYEIEPFLYANACCIQRDFSTFVGFRYMRLDEAFNIESTDLASGTSDYNILAGNELYGAQVGARLRDAWDWFGIDVVAKVGVFGNDARQEQFVTDQGATVLLRPTVAAADERVAFLGELGGSITCQLTDGFALRFGYNVVWIEGLALAPDQLDFTTLPQSGTLLSTDGGVVLHGANAGVEVYW